MKVLVIGDVHGCYHTFKTLVENHWDPKNQRLIQLGDLINKGKHSGLTLKYWLELEAKYGDQVTLLRGNHEQTLINHLNSASKDSSLNRLVENIREAGLDIYNIVEWLNQTPLKWESEGLIITHAGISKHAKDPVNPVSPSGVLYNRAPLKRFAKQQILGHSIVEGNKPVFNTRENAWYIDTGAWTKKFLSGLIVNEDGTEVKVVRQERTILD